jgi:N utilization substance protein A
MSATPDAEDEFRLLLRLHVPDIASGAVQVRGVAREPGQMCMVCVADSGAGRDPIASCTRGVRSIVHSLAVGERVMLLRWCDSPETLIRDALAPARLGQIDLNAVNHRARVTCGAGDASRLTSGGGVHLRLASRLTGWDLELTAA